MLGLRFYVCASCDAVSADPAGSEPSRECSRCGGTVLREITERVQDDAYFYPDQ